MIVQSLRSRPEKPTSSTIRVGVIGAGFGAAVHIPALQQIAGVKVVAVCARRAERAHLAAAQHGVPAAVSDYRELTADTEIDAIVVASPPYLHHSMTIAALEAGKHVLCEKPMARSLAEARDMVKIAERAGVTAMINHEFRFLPARARAKELIDGGYLGEPQTASLTIYRASLNDPHGIPFGWLMQQDKAGGMLGAAGSHHIDSLRWWFGEVKSVAGAVGTMVKRRRLPESQQMATVDADDNFAPLLKFVSGAIATIHYSATAAYDLTDQIVLSGSEGMLMLTSEGLLYGAKRREPMTEQELPGHVLGAPPSFDHPLIQPTTALSREWIAAIREKRQASPSFADGIKVQEILDGVVRSSQQGRWVDVGRGRFGPGSGSA
ncbi:MAG: Gfo/Idh/MocA family protein [Thermomicrobiales bacterium]